MSAGRTIAAVRLDRRQLSDVEFLWVGAYEPLDGFLTSADYEAVVEEMRLASGDPWSVPITLAVDDQTAAAMREGDTLALLAPSGQAVAHLTVQDKYRYDKRREAERVYRTADDNHPGVAALYAQGDTLLGGPVRHANLVINHEFAAYRRTPDELKRLCRERGLRTMVGFQTRNPVHRAHEYIQRTALEIVDGLLLHPIVGVTTDDDIPADIRMRCYEVLLEHYFPRERVILSVFPAAMRYAGPREAVFHALVHRNYGCTHFIVGRGHAGVGDYYGPYDAQDIFREFEPGELGITPLFFEHAFWCRACGGMATPKACPHSDDERLRLSGRRVRAMLRNHQPLPPEFTRPEVAEVPLQAYPPGT